MKTVIFHGDSTSLGRFGVVEEGAHLQLTEAEFLSVREDARFELISRRRPARAIQPLGTCKYDLRLVLWDHSRIESVLAKKGKTTLTLIAEAMCLVGAEVPVSIHDNTPAIVDAIIAEARALGWTLLDRDARLALGSLEDTPIEPEESESTEGEPGLEGAPAVPEPKPKTRRKA